MSFNARKYYQLCAGAIGRIGLPLTLAAGLFIAIAGGLSSGFEQLFASQIRDSFCVFRLEIVAVMLAFLAAFGVAVLLFFLASPRETTHRNWIGPEDF